MRGPPQVMGGLCAHRAADMGGRAAGAVLRVSHMRSYSFDDCIILYNKLRGPREECSGAAADSDNAAL
jgi:hypothetical protein